MLWYKSIVLFGVGSNPYDVDADDTDLKLLPSLLEKTVLTKLTGGLSLFHLDKLGCLSHSLVFVYIWGRSQLNCLK